MPGNAYTWMAPIGMHGKNLIAVPTTDGHYTSLCKVSEPRIPSQQRGHLSHGQLTPVQVGLLQITGHSEKATFECP